MISFDFEYHKPDSLEEAIECYRKLTSENKSVMYYGGGTEIISMARAESLRFSAVIDLKGIPECNELLLSADKLIIGSAVTLTNIEETGHFPLLCQTVSRIADHTIQGKITLGGNLAGTIIYREAALPLMITNSSAEIMTSNGLKELPFYKVFNGRLLLQNGEFIIRLMIDQKDINLPYMHVKKTKMDKIDYPLITLAGIKKDGKVQAAVSGASDMPMLLSSELINDLSISEDERIKNVISGIDNNIKSDFLGSKDYRKFVLRNILSQMLENFHGV